MPDLAPHRPRWTFRTLELAASLPLILFGPAAQPATAAGAFPPAAGTFPPAAGTSSAAGGTSDAAATGQESEAGPTARQRRQIELFASLLLSDSEDVDPETRISAAQELTDLRLEDATAVLDQALRSGESAKILAVVTAMERAPRPPQPLLEPTLAALAGAAPEMLDLLAMVLSRYGEAARSDVSELALDRGAPVSDRLGPVHALGSFRSLRAAESLMTLLDERRNEPPEIVDAVCDSLERLSRVPHGRRPDRWRRWWQTAKDEPIDDWLRRMVETLSEHVAELELRLQQQQRDIEARERRLADTYRDFFPGLSIEQQQQKLPALLDDPVAPLREFAIRRVERLLRDQERIAEPVQQKLASRLDDPDPAIRRRVVPLLDVLNYPDLAALLATELAEESDPSVVRQYLAVLAKRSTPAAVEPLRAWLDDDKLGPAAADALWSALKADLLPAASRAPIAEDLRAAGGASASPSHARLLAVLGEPDDLETITPLLDHPDATVRRTVGQGLVQRGLVEPLVSRAGDEALFPLAIEALTNGPADLALFRRLAMLEPPAAHQENWAGALRAVAAELPGEQLLATDDILAELDHAEASLRADLLARLDAIPPEQLAADQRELVLRRRADLLLQLQQPEAALQWLDRHNGTATSEALQEQHFRVAVLAGRFDRASELSNDPKHWIDLVKAMASQDEAHAAALRREILRRFPDLDDGLKAELESAGAGPPATSAAEAAPPESPG